MLQPTTHDLMLMIQRMERKLDVLLHMLAEDEDSITPPLEGTLTPRDQSQSLD